jgi:1-deoxy-D-xylulose-5-phosphate reductoisomerase
VRIHHSLDDAGDVVEGDPPVKERRDGDLVGSVQHRRHRAANEVAVAAFLDGRISFDDIPRIVERVMDAHTTGAALDLETVEAADRWARTRAASLTR